MAEAQIIVRNTSDVKQLRTLAKREWGHPVRMAPLLYGPSIRTADEPCFEEFYFTTVTVEENIPSPCRRTRMQTPVGIPSVEIDTTPCRASSSMRRRSRPSGA